ncbi:MAG: outer membrane protein assembly factor BamA [Rhodothermales bacterium]|nr:outer membrane protein assembly factor BamA [Rhodothermales bacterium]
MTRPLSRLLFAALLVLSAPAVLAPAARAQSLAQAGGALPTPQQYEVLGVSAEGVADEATRQFVLQTSGFQAGDRVTIPGDEVISDAIRRLYELGNFTDVDVIAEKFVGNGVFLLVRVEEVPRVGEYAFEGIKGGWKDDLRRQVPLLRGRALREADVERSRQLVLDYLAEKGYRAAAVEVRRTPAADGRVNLTFVVERGEKVEVADVRFFGNAAYGEKTLRKRLKNTPENRWWRFWGGETFDDDGFEEDLDNLVKFYNDRGYYSARVVRDSVWVRTDEGEPELVVDVYVEEGPQYVVRDIAFDGNTEYTDEQLRAALGIEPGETYNRSKIEQNLYYTQDHSDITSLYSDQGYLRFNIRPTVQEVEGDSLDLLFQISEGDVYEFGQVSIKGNTRTKDYVVRRQLRTVPGQTYSRQAIERSIRELMQLNYFDQEGLAEGPRVAIDEEEKEVDLTYNLVETGGDQLELSGGWGGGGYGVILQARVTFNNFSIQNLFDPSAWRPIPSGDGQQLSLAIQTNGARYQNYSVSFTEPWFRGRNTPVGFSLSYTHRDFSSRTLFGGSSTTGELTDRNQFSSFSGRLFYRQQLKWPDDFFQTGTDLSYRRYDVDGASFSNAYGLPLGISQELTVRQSLTRNSFDNPLFPSVGSSLLLSAEVATPVPGFIQYHKERFQTKWVTPVIGRIALSFDADFGYIGSLTGDDVEFQRFLVGGSPLDVQGGYLGYGKDLLFMRGYPLGAISPRAGGRLVGGRILNKYSMEARLLALQSPQLSFAPYVFLDAANAWSGFDAYNPADLYRSAGFGAKVFLPILGMVDLNYGYQIDSFVDTNPSSNTVITPRWRFQFSLGGQ